MIRVLFVDDEPRILDGLQRMLRLQRREWEMSFALGSEAALAAVEAQSFDVVVSDMRMPGTDGAALLTRFQERSPGTVRIILSGQTNSEAAERAARVAHQFLMKPTSAEVLRDTIARVCGQRTDLPNDAVQRVIGGIDTLPVLPRLYAEISELISDPDASLDRVAHVIAQDVAMSAKVLQLVHSPFFGFSGQAASVRTAVSLLGTRTIKNLVLSADVFRSFSERLRSSGFSGEAFQMHSMRVSRLAESLVSNEEHAETAQLAGMLHDVGKLVLADRLAGEFDQLTRNARERDVPLHVVEQEVLGVTHADVGAYLLRLWNLPRSLVEAVAHHHAPRRAGSSQFDALAAVHVANVLVHEVSTHSPGSGANERLDELYLSELGVAEQLPVWRARAQEDMP